MFGHFLKKKLKNKYIIWVYRFAAYSAPVFYKEQIGTFNDWWFGEKREKCVDINGLSSVQELCLVLYVFLFNFQTMMQG